MKKYYYADSQGKQAGPVSYEELASLHQRGLINSTTQVFEEGTTDWKPYSAHNFPGAAMPGYDSVGAGIPPKKSGCSWPFIIGMGCLLMVCAAAGIGLLTCGAAFYGISAFSEGMKKDAQGITAEIASNADVQRELGTNLEASLPSPYNYNTVNGTETLVASFELTGSKGKGTVHVDRKKPSGGTWHYNKLQLEVNGKTYDLSGSTGGGNDTGTHDDSSDEKGKMKLHK
ncbi:MAG: cytochrome c oxidase assembly factor Coa1 family protein [Candidatus Methylacidiphilales bacterium]|nr:cytochrome c oxidase assembly factor Coa1 family protein [Candidatus Methylacidiphilales bacterium]